MKKNLPAFVLDFALVIVFCVIGRRSHDEAGALSGLVHTAWPFVVGLVIGWAILVARYRTGFVAIAIVPAGVVVWLSTLIAGMLLRVVSGQGTAVSFIVVAAIVLVVFLIGWRVIAQSSAARKRRMAP